MTNLPVKDIMQTIGLAAKNSSSLIANLESKVKNKALLTIAKKIRENKDNITKANKIDVENAIEKGLEESMIDRLKLDDERIESIASSIEQIAKLDDPVGIELSKWQRPSGLSIKQVSVPLGVIGIIYESRPNVTADAAALCIKSGNVAILRGGSESFHSSQAILDAIHAGLEENNIDKNIVQLVPTTDRAAVGEMLTMTDFIDVIVPRGGKGLCKRIQDESKVPTLQHLDGNCHVYVHKSADLDIALKVIKNAKLRRTGICGAAESLVINREIANEFIPKIVDVLSDCEIRGEQEAINIDNRIKLVNESDWDTEYLDKIISLKIVDDIDEAIKFVNKHSSHHTDCIISSEEDSDTDEFLKKIDSAIVMHNTSTQFADGGEFGMGAEIGISTGKLHARGPVGIRQLTTYKYIVTSDGKVRG